MALTFDERTKTLVAGTSTGYLIFFRVEGVSEIIPSSSLCSEAEVPVTSMGTLNRGINLCIASFANGLIWICSFDGSLVAEITAHSRCINAIACHPTRSVFASVSDDTFMNLFEV